MKILMTSLISKNVDYYKVDALNKSFLSDFSISPAHAFTKKTSMALSEGSLFHEYVLEPDIFKEKNTITGLNLSTKAGREFKKKNKNKNIIKEADLIKFSDMKENLLTYEFFDRGLRPRSFKDLLARAVIEQGILSYCHISNREFELKIKPDFYCLEADRVLCFDIKTVETADLTMFKYSAKKYKYHWQSFLYSSVLKFYYNKPVEFIFVLVEKQKPYGIRLVKIKSDYAMGEVESCINKYLNWAKSSNKNECYLPIINTVEI